jgi:cardiolipin synthase
MPMYLPSVLLDRAKTREVDPVAKRKRWGWFNILASIALILQSGILFLALFEPPLGYVVSNPLSDPLDSDQFLKTLNAVTDGHLSQGTRLEVLTDGDQYYPAELQAIASAQKVICLEAYIFDTGKITRQFVDALVDRARAGVKVHMVIDAVGSAGFSRSEIDRLKEAGGEVQWYLPPRWYTWPRINNRTHRELLVVDGRVGFIGGAGWGDHWLEPQKDDQRAWRDVMLRVEGPAVAGLQSAFSENWLEASGELLTGRDYYRFEPGTGDSKAIVVRSSPTTGRSTPARVLFQVLVASARQRIYMSTPYFLPDDSIRDELRRAVNERGVDVEIITPGPGTDHLLTRRSSRRLFGPLLQAGVHIYEYQPSMMHAKFMIVDGLWIVMGSTNIDPRSFTLNDEVNLASPDSAVAQILEQDFQRDLQDSKKVTYEEWKSRGIAERLHEAFGGLIENQQ